MRPELTLTERTVYNKVGPEGVSPSVHFDGIMQRIGATGASTHDVRNALKSLVRKGFVVAHEDNRYSRTCPRETGIRRPS